MAETLKKFKEIRYNKIKSILKTQIYIHQGLELLCASIHLIPFHKMQKRSWSEIWLTSYPMIEIPKFSSIMFYFVHLKVMFHKFQNVDVYFKGAYSQYLQCQ